MKNLLSIAAASLLLAAGAANAQSVHSLSYSAKRVPPGTIVTLGGQNFVLVRLPMADFGSTDRYIVEFLAEVLVPGSPPSFQASLQTEHSNETLTNPIVVSGFPAVAQVSDGRDYRFGSSFTGPGNSLTVAGQAFGVVQVKVGGTMITFFQSFTTEQQPETAAAVAAPYSGSPVAQWPLYVDPTVQVAALDDWIDYVRILKIN